MPGTIVEPPASMTWTSGGRAPSSLLERIQTTWPASTRTLTSFRRDGPLGSARAASRYKVGRETIIEAPGVSSDSTSTFKDCLAEPDERRVRWEPLRLREERPEPRVAIVLLMGLVTRGDDLKDVILNAGSLLTPAACADEASLVEPTAACEVVPDRDLLGLEHRFEIRCTISGDSEDNRCRLRRLGRCDLGFPRHASTMREGLLKSKRVAPERAYRFLGMAPPWTQTMRGNARHIRARCTAWSQPLHASILMRRACCPDRMVDIRFPELLTLVPTVAIILAIVIAVYFSRKQIEALATDTEARVVNDLDEKLHRMGEIFMEKPEFVRILNDDAAVSNFGAEVAFAFYVMFFCSHCYHMRQRGILSDNDWAGWLQWTKNAFRSGRLGKYWKEAEMQAWVDPAFREFVNQEILVGT